MNTKEEIWLKLYIIEKSPNTPETLNKLRALLDQYSENYKLEIIDILKAPEMIINDNIMASPTLIKVKPLPSKRIVGNIQFNNLVSEFNLFSNSIT